MSKYIDLSGQKFNEWTVENYAGNSSWNCVCSCGNRSVVQRGSLLSGKSKSCGCKNKTSVAVGKRYGRLLVTREVEPHFRNNGAKVRMFECLCDCGNTTILSTNALSTQNTQSCGCLHRDNLSQMTMKHGACAGGKRTRLYKVWRNMKTRCFAKNNGDYSSYGGRGITVCDEWKDNFQAFHDWAYANGYKEEVLPNGVNKLTLDRTDFNGNYEPSNCRWITIQEQQRNKRTTIFLEFKGERLSLTDIAEKYNIPADRLYQRIRKGWETERAILTPKEY